MDNIPRCKKRQFNMILLNTILRYFPGEVLPWQKMRKIMNA